MTNVEALKDVYVALGGAAADVANADSNVDMLNAIIALFSGTSADTNAEAIENLSDVVTGVIKPTGTKTITENGSDIDVTEYAAVDVSVPQPSGTISITENGTGIDVAQYATANVAVPPDNTDLINLIERDITAMTIPSGTTVIGQFAFQGCGDLQSVSIPASVTTISARAFSDSALTEIVIPDTVTTFIMGYQFAECSELESVTLPQSLSEIPSGMFENCTSLPSIVISFSITKIGVDAFRGCTSLTDIYYTGTQAQWESITGLSGAGIPAGATIHYEYTPI